MRKIAIAAAVAASAAVALVGPASAVVCAPGVYHSGCAGGHSGLYGGAGHYRNGVYTHPNYKGVGCVWSNGKRVCHK